LPFLAKRLSELKGPAPLTASRQCIRPGLFYRPLVIVVIFVIIVVIIITVRAVVIIIMIVV
jgi:hypothetical protein